MVKYCTALNCSQGYKKGVKFHRFPSEINLRKQWVIALGRENYVPSNSAVICQKHFKESDYKLNVHGNLVLNKDAVPSVFNFFGQLEKKQKTMEVLIKKELSPVTEEPSTSKEHPLLEQLTISKNNSFLESESTVLYTSLIADAVPISVAAVPIKQMVKKRRYIGDFTEEDLDCPKKRHQYWNISQNCIEKYRKKTLHLNTKIFRQKKKINALNDLLQELKKKYNLSLESSLFLKECAGQAEKQLILCQFKDGRS